MFILIDNFCFVSGLSGLSYNYENPMYSPSAVKTQLPFTKMINGREYVLTSRGKHFMNLFKSATSKIGNTLGLNQILQNGFKPNASERNSGEDDAEGGEDEEVAGEKEELKRRKPKAKETTEEDSSQEEYDRKYDNRNRENSDKSEVENEQEPKKGKNRKVGGNREKSKKKPKKKRQRRV